MDALSVDDFKKRVENLVANLPTEILKINLGLAQSAIPLITGRIINQGENGKGKKFGQYSVNPLPTFFFTNKGTGKGADSKFDALVKRKKKEASKAKEKFKGVSYKEVRELNNLPTSYVTLSFTGETMRDIGVIDERIDGSVVMVGIGPRNTKNKAKYNARGEKIGETKSEDILDHLGERYGEDILTATPEEEQLLAEAYGQEIEKLFERYLA